MKDLYKQLGLPARTNDTQSIRQAVNQPGVSAELASDAMHILLTPQRKKVYDEAHRAASDVAALRSNLGLDRVAGVDETQTRDFEVSPRNTTPELERFKLYTQTKVRPQPQDEQLKQRTARNAFLACVALFVGVIIFPSLVDKADDADSSLDQAASTATQEERDIPSLFEDSIDLWDDEEGKHTESTGRSVALPVVPRNGTIIQAPYATPRAPLEIVTSGKRNYFVKVVDGRTDDLVMSFFVHGGKRAEVQVPLGSFKLRYAAGNDWRGEDAKMPFGPDTAFSEAKDTFNFRRTSNGYRGYTVELIMQQRGNLEVERLRPDDF